MVSYLMETCTTSDTLLATWYRTKELTNLGNCPKIGVGAGEKRTRPTSRLVQRLVRLPSRNHAEVGPFAKTGKLVRTHPTVLVR
jgi:hypothetical protein